MALSSSSTRDDVLAAYADNASYEEDASVAKAKAFVTACRMLLSPKHSAALVSGPGLQVQIGLKQIAGELAAAQSWLAANDQRAPAGEVIHASFEEFRE